MKSADVTLAEHVANVEATKAAAADIAEILNAKYQKEHGRIFNMILNFKTAYNHTTADHTQY
eukprot:3996909-Ditylum_brightwellii.AAC.2